MGETHTGKNPNQKEYDMKHIRTAWIRLIARVTTSDRGDVPGWVLVAVMTAGLVTALWLVADDALTSVLDRAINSVSGP